MTDNRDQPKPPPPGLPPSIVHLRDQGVTHFRMSCKNPNCQHVSDTPLDQLGLPEETLFPSIAMQRRWRCERCGSRMVTVMPRWPAR